MSNIPLGVALKSGKAGDKIPVAIKGQYPTGSFVSLNMELKEDATIGSIVFREDVTGPTNDTPKLINPRNKARPSRKQWRSVINA